MPETVREKIPEKASEIGKKMNHRAYRGHREKIKDFLTLRYELIYEDKRDT